MTITEFLLARIAEDEAGHGCPYEAEWAVHANEERTCCAGDRVLAECEAKRQIMQYAADVQADVVRLTDHIPYVKVRVEASILHLLALPYADHPDYQQEWA